MKRRSGALALTAAFLVPASPAHAQDRACSGSLGAVTVENLGVPQNARCELNGTTVEGNIVVNRGASLSSSGGSVEGNIQAEGAARVLVGNSRIGGSFQIKQGGGAEIRSTPVEGDIQLESNNGRVQHVIGNRVGGNVQINQNRGGVDIVGNTIDGNLQCQANDAAPRGGSNTVRGSSEAQCASLRPADPAPRPTQGPGPAPDPGSPGTGPGTGAAPLPMLRSSTLRTVSRGSRVRVALACPRGGARCQGRIGLSLRRDRSARAANLGGTRFSIAPGRRATVALRLTGRGRALARSTRRLKVTLTIRAGGRTVNRRAVVR
jgi:hypothetical protein